MSYQAHLLLFYYAACSACERFYVEGGATTTITKAEGSSGFGEESTPKQAKGRTLDIRV